VVRGGSPGGPLRSATVSEKKMQKLYQTLNECNEHPYMSDDLQQKVDELLLYVIYCPPIIILENILNDCTEKKEWLR
jgi:hypothetical protein